MKKLNAFADVLFKVLDAEITTFVHNVVRVEIRG